MTGGTTSDWRCAATLLRVYIALRVRGLHRVLVATNATPLGAPSPDDDRIEAARRIARAVERTAALLPLRARCIEQSIAMLVLCRRRGIPCRLQIGARPLPFAAHAWVEVDGVAVNGDTELLTGFAPFPEPER